MDIFSLKDKKALVTGGNTGIGLAMAKALARAGASIAITARNKEKNLRALEELKTINVNCHAYEFDLNDSSQIELLYSRISGDCGGIDILINNAGIHRRNEAQNLSLEDFETVMRVNTTSGFLLSKYFAQERIKKGKSGNIIFTASLMSEASRPTTCAYTASKGAIRQMIKSLAVDWAKYNIRVNGIGPGYINTNLNAHLIADPEFDAWVKKRTPLGRWGEGDDFDGVVVFLASEAAKFITGQIIYVDGGFLATF